MILGPSMPEQEKTALYLKAQFDEMYSNTGRTLPVITRSKIEYR